MKLFLGEDLGAFNVYGDDSAQCSLAVSRSRLQYRLWYSGVSVGIDRDLWELIRERIEYTLFDSLVTADGYSP